jgi:hypothetical protein
VIQAALAIVITSEAIHLSAQSKNGLLRRFAPLRKRFAFVAGNDGDRSVDRLLNYILWRKLK